MAIQETLFGPKRYLTLRKSISTDKISDKMMYDEAGAKLGAYMEKNGMRPSGAWSVLYFLWDEANKKTEIGIGFPIQGLESINDAELSITDVPESKASMDVLRGSYEGLGKVHQSLMKYVKDTGYDGKDLPVMAVEEYVIDPMAESDSEKWVTNIYYLHN